MNKKKCKLFRIHVPYNLVALCASVALISLATPFSSTRPSSLADEREWTKLYHHKTCPSRTELSCNNPLCYNYLHLLLFHVSSHSKHFTKPCKTPDPPLSKYLLKH